MESFKKLNKKNFLIKVSKSKKLKKIIFLQFYNLQGFIFNFLTFDEITYCFYFHNFRKTVVLLYFFHQVVK